MSGLVRFYFCLLLVILTGCSFARSNSASEARHRMIGLSKEDVLACMGPPGKKAQVGDTEVWQFSSGGGYSGTGGKEKITKDFTLSSSEGYKIYCHVNIVMKNDVVHAVHYNGPRGGLLTPDEQCGYAIEHCVE